MYILLLSTNFFRLGMAWLGCGSGTVVCVVLMHTLTNQSTNFDIIFLGSCIKLTHPNNTGPLFNMTHFSVALHNFRYSTLLARIGRQFCLVHEQLALFIWQKGVYCLDYFYEFQYFASPISPLSIAGFMLLAHKHISILKSCHEPIKQLSAPL